MTDLLLVHGSFHTARCWDALLPELKANGVDARAIDLPGHGENVRNPWRVSMAAYRDAVIEAALAAGGNLAVLGHSLGGQVISAAAQVRPDLFASMIYLSAFVPGPAGSHVMTMPTVTADMKRLVRPQVAAMARGVLTVGPEAACTVFYNGCDPETQRVAVDHLCPQPIRPTAVSRVRVTQDRLGSVSKHYVECLIDNALPVESQRGMIANAAFASVTTLNSDHSPFYSMPAQLAGSVARLL